MAAIDRKNQLLRQAELTGIDFVAVDLNQVTLDVFLFHDASKMTDARGLPEPLTTGDLIVTVTGEEEPSIPVVSTAFATVDGREVLRVKVKRPGGFARYWLDLAGARIDPFFRTIEIDFKAGCPRDVDCAREPHECPPIADDPVLVDPGARDFWSLRRALFELASLRFPRWKDRLEADVGVMLVEVLAAIGDELAYYQDRVAREAQFGSSGQRRSVRRHVRLVDYELHDGLGATGWLAVEVQGGWRQIPAGTPAWAVGEGTAIGFEIGDGLADVLGGPTVRTFRAHEQRNRLVAHLWDGDEPDPHAEHRPLAGACLPVGATTLHIDGHHAARFQKGEQVFLVTEPPPTERDVPERRLLVTLAVDPTDETDPLGAALGTSGDITRLTWLEPTDVELDLAWTRVLGNVVPITAGITRTTTFSIGPSTGSLPQAIERVGANRSIAFLHTLPTRGPAPSGLPGAVDVWRYLEDQDVVRLGAHPRASRPEVALHQVTPPAFVVATGEPWSYRPTLIGSNSSEAQDLHFTLDDGTWGRAVGYQRLGGEVVHHDYLSGAGATIRFGDGEFGAMPPRGNARPNEEVFFTATYRLGNGVRGNLPADALRYADPAGATSWSAPLGFITRVWNPLPTAGGVEPETIAQAKRDAPDEFRAVTYRAVRPEDYDEAAGRLPWVQQAGTTFRWTGSWSSVFTAADPRSRADLPPDQRRALGEHLDRFRMTGREVHVLAPRYADLDLVITVCVQPYADRSAVVTAILRALIGRRGLRPMTGFFDPDHFTFGTPLDRSELEACIQRVPGVRAVKGVEYARRGRFERKPFTDPYYQPARDEVVRVTNDPRYPTRGTITIIPEGGA